MRAGRVEVEVRVDVSRAIQQITELTAAYERLTASGRRALATYQGRHTFVATGADGVSRVVVR